MLCFYRIFKVFDKTGTITKDGMDFIQVQPVEQKTFKPIVHVDEKSYTWLSALAPELQQAVGSCHTVTALADGTKVGNNVEVSMVETSGFSLPPATGKQIANPPPGGNVGPVEILRRFEFDHVRMTSGTISSKLKIMKK